MNADTLISFFERDLNKLINEIELYKNEENIWRLEKNISNSALHLIGNLNAFIGKEIGKQTMLEIGHWNFLKRMFQENN